MELVITILAFDAVFVAVLFAGYFMVTRRRSKIYVLVEHLASLCRAGLPLQTGLRALGSDLGGLLGTRVTRAARRIEEGAPLSAALGSMPRTFPPLLRTMIELGERSGNLAAFLEEMRRSYRRLVEEPYRNLYSMLYPVLLSMAIALAGIGLSVEIAPKMEEVMLQQRVIADPYSRWWPWLLGAEQGVLAACVLLALFLLLGGFTPHFGFSLWRTLKRGIDPLALRLPLIGLIIRTSAAQAFAGCVGNFLRAGASMPEAVRAAAQSARNESIRARLEKVAQGVAEGMRLSEALRKVGLFGEPLLWCVTGGEASGTLPEGLLQAAGHYDTKGRLAVHLASRIVIPAFILVNGILVLATCLLVFLPILQIQRASIPP